MRGKDDTMDSISDAQRAALQGRKVLVTGGAGFVGSQLVERLVRAGAEVVVMDDLFTGRADAIAEGATLVQGSVTDLPAVRQQMQGVHLVFHLAARNILVSTRDPQQDYQTNIGGTLNVLLAARDSGTVQRLLYTSSASVYGNPRNAFCHEDDPVYCLSPYAASKLGGESYCTAFFESYDLPVSVVRYSNVYGDGQDARNPYCGVVSKFLKLAQRGEPLQIHGDGLQTRDYTYIADAVEATLQAALSPRAVGEIFNIGTGIETSVQELANQINALHGGALTVEHVDRRDIDNLRRRVMNIERIRKALRWAPNYSLAEGLRRTLTWCGEHPEALSG